MGVHACPPCWGRAASLIPLPPQAQRHISDLYEDLRDGHNLISLLEVLSGDSLVRAPAPHPLEPRLPFPQTPLLACLPWGLSRVPGPRPAQPGPLLRLPAWERPRPPCHTRAPGPAGVRVGAPTQ